MGYRSLIPYPTLSITSSSNSCVNQEMTTMNKNNIFDKVKIIYIKNSTIRVLLY